MFLFNLTTAVLEATPNISQGQCSKKHYIWELDAKAALFCGGNGQKQEVTWYKYNPEKTLKPERHSYRRVVVMAGQVLSW